MKKLILALALLLCSGCSGHIQQDFLGIGEAAHGQAEAAKWEYAAQEHEATQETIRTSMRMNMIIPVLLVFGAIAIGGIYVYWNGRAKVESIIMQRETMLLAPPQSAAPKLALKPNRHIIEYDNYLWLYEGDRLIARKPVAQLTVSDE